MIDTLGKTNCDESNFAVECTFVAFLITARSVSALVTRCFDKNSRTSLPVVQEDHELALEQPKVVVIDEEGGTRLTVKKNPSQLPYLNRNPAI